MAKADHTVVRNSLTNKASRVGKDPVINIGTAGQELLQKLQNDEPQHNFTSCLCSSLKSKYKYAIAVE